MEGNCIISNKLSNMESNSNGKIVHPKSNKKLTTEEFISRAKLVHGDKYDYSKVNYINAKTKICIICPVHGEFWTLPSIHLSGHKCPKCVGGVKLSKEDFITKAKEIHNNKYDYSKVDYKNTITEVCIICPEHGEFWQKPIHHIQGKGCPYCGGTKKLSTEEFIKRAKKIHNNKYDYSKVDYVGSHMKVCIICPKHGEFLQTPHSHLRGSGCPYCNKGIKYTSDEFITLAKKIHNNKYDYSKVNYINTHTKVCIICPDHGEFWQEPAVHLSGCGCPICNESKLELIIQKLLKSNYIEYDQEKTFDWLKNDSYMFLDFYLPEYNIGIECQGIQHFNPIEYFGGNDAFESTRDRDILKQKLCKEHNIEILYYTDVKLEEYPYDVITDLDELIKRIKNY